MEIVNMVINTAFKIFYMLAIRNMAKMRNFESLSGKCNRLTHRL